MDVDPEELAKTYSELVDEELLRLHGSGELTDIAYDVLEAELTKRGIPIPQRKEENTGQLRPDQLKVLLDNYRENQSLSAAILSGLTSSLIAAVIWAFASIVSEYQLGFTAIGVGLIVGYSVRIAGKGIDTIFGVTGGVFSLLGCILGNYLIVIYFVAINEGMTFMHVFAYLSLESVIEIMVDTFALADIIFYVIAVYFGFRFSINKISPAVVYQAMKMTPGEIRRIPVAKANTRAITIITTAFLFGVAFFLYENWPPTDTQIVGKYSLTAAQLGEELSVYYKAKNTESVAEWIANVDEIYLLESNGEATSFAPLCGFFGEVFKNNPDLLSEWLKIIDSLSSKSSKELFWSALWCSNTMIGMVYLENKLNTVEVDDEITFLKEMLSKDPPRFETIIPGSPSENDFLWGAFFASGNPAYIENLIAIACRYNDRNDLMTFATAGTAKWSLASNAQKHEIVMQTLENERTERGAEDRDIINDIIEKALMPTGPILINEEVHAIINQMISEGDQNNIP